MQSWYWASQHLFFTRETADFIQLLIVIFLLNTSSAAFFLFYFYHFIISDQNIDSFCIYEICTVNSADYQSKFSVRKTTTVLTLAITVYLTVTDFWK